MKLIAVFLHRFRWLNVPGALLIALLQRTPVVRVAAVAEESVLASPISTVLRSAIGAIASLGAMHSLAGATQFTFNRTPPIAGTVGTALTPFAFTVTGAQTPAGSFRVTGLPPGLVVGGANSSGLVNASSGVISGTPTTSGAFSVSILAFELANAQGDQFGPTTVVFNISAGTQTAPTITLQPVGQSISVGGTATFTTAASGSPTPTLQWRKNGTAISGATASSFTISNAKVDDAGDYSVAATNSVGSATSSTATLTITTTTSLAFTLQPIGQSVGVGSPVAFTAAATGSPTPTFQWRKNGAAISGATGASLAIASAAASDAGDYTVVASNSSGSLTSNVATLTVATVDAATRLKNLSVRTAMAANQTLIVGVVVNGGSRDVLVRAAGPALATFGLSTAMADPRLDLFNGATLVFSNDDWPASLATTFASVGAFGFASGSKDAAFLLPINAASSIQAHGTGPGVVLVEAYDAGGGASARLINVSARNRVGTGDDILIAGFVLDGSGGKRLLIRAVGPTLGAAPFNVPGTLLDPKLEVYSGSTKLTENDNWDASLASTFTSVGAFQLLAGSRDAALVATLPAGSYTVQVKGADGGTGEALIEIYELP